MTVMDNTMNGSHIDVLENLSLVINSLYYICTSIFFYYQTDDGPQILSNLNNLNRICGRSILTKGGRIRGNFSYHGTNLGMYNSADNYMNHNVFS